MKRICLSMLLLSFSLVALAQETNCSDGIDNDGDGFVDCFDSDCANSAACDDSYIGKDKLCQDPPEGTLGFGMELAASSVNRTALSYGRMVVGDLDRDGTPELVTTHRNDKKIYILDGRDLSIKRTINTTGMPEYFDHAIANLDDDDCGEIFIVEEISSKFYVTSYDCNGTKLWSTQAYGRPFTIGLADFDHDGLVELYYKNEILDAKTGEILVKGKGTWNNLDSGPVAVDILPDAACGECAGLELVLGGLIYAVDLTPRTAGGGSVGNPIRNFNDTPGLGSIVYHPKYVNFGYVNSMTSVADYNLDGHLDVIMSGATSSSSTSTTTVFFWDVHNNTFRTFQPKQPNNSSWPHGTGRINLADVDGDGKMNATFVSGARIYSLKEDFTLLWQQDITEQTSGFTSTTVFDFNNDNAVEIVYRDEASLYIIDGKTGNKTAVPCRSRTANDYPIVVDVDGDGATEICVSCATSDNTNINDDTNTPNGQIRMYKSSLEPWVSARKVWNQYAYFNVNVNDDLTIPQVQQKHHLVFSQDVCGTGENRALNSFLNQSAILDSKGCKTYPAADVAFVANPSLLNVVPPTCPDGDFLVSFSLQNVGDLDLTGDFPITFYNGDPRLAGAQKLGTQTISFSNFRIGDQIDIQDMVVSGTGGTFTLFAVLNDAGTTVPTPISLPNSGFAECNFSNNVVSASVVPRPFPLATVATDHVQCGVGPSPPSGSARVFKPEGSNEQTLGYTFHWFNGTTAGAVGSADYVGSEITGLANGTYTVYAVHNAMQCGSDTVQVAVGLQSLAISATVNVDQPYTNCIDPDGQLSVTPSSGSVNDFTYEWFEGIVFGTTPSLSDSSVLRFTRALTYSVLVTQKSSGCETLESGTVPDMTVTPVVTTSFTAANCAPANSGQATAVVDGVTSGYTFYWYDGSTAKPTEDHLGHTYPNISAGNYTVVSRDNTTGCRSQETVVAVPTIDGITVAATITAQQTSCTTPNGAASANVGGTTTGYSFRWFDGDNTVTEIGTSATISGLAAGTYTVQATNIATGCSDTELITIVDNILMPTVTPSLVANQMSCLPANGAVSAIATGSPGPYIYYWFDGNIGTPDTTAADFKGADYTGVTAGFYTVVAVDVNSRCGSARGLIEVLDQTVDPVVTTSVVGQSNCDPVTPNGHASAEVGGTTTGYKFRWFTGADTTNFLLENSTLADRAAGTYTVKAISLATGCFTTAMVLINDISAQPSLALTKQDNSICSPGIGFTGSVTATFATNPNSQPGHTYTYEWQRNGVIIPGETGATISGIDAGTYTVTVTNENLGCVSDPVEIVVDDAVDLPTLTTANTGSTNCDLTLANGSAYVATVDGATPGSTNDYTYQWHIGNGTTTPIDAATNPSATTAVLTGVQGGAASYYTVLVTNSLTGCENTAVVNVADLKVLPELTLSPTHNTVCDPMLTSPTVQFNGTITTTVSNIVGSLADYTFVLDGGAGTQDASPNHNRFLELEGGINYTVTATHSLTGCVSTPADIQVQNNQDIPDLVTGSDGSTNCDPLLADGQARVVSVDGAAATTTGFTFAWTGSMFDVSGHATNDDIQLESVQGGAGQNYTVLVTNLSNGCQNTAVVNVADSKQTPFFTLTSTPVTICDPALAVLGGGVYDGAITAAINATGNYAAATSTDFNFTWSTGLNGVGENVLQNVDGGNYSLTAVHTLTGCASDPHQAQVSSARVLPTISTSSVASQNCVGGAPDGIATVTNVVPNGRTYDYRWFDADGSAGPVLLNTTATTSSYADVQGGMNGASLYEYTVEVTILQTGCVNTAVVAVEDDSEVPVLGPLAGTDNTLCTIAKDGTATITTLSYRGSAIAPSDFGDYEFVWSDGIQGPAETITALAAGSYTLTVRNLDDNCASNPAAVTIDDDLFFPQIDVVSVDQTSCDPLTPNGSLAASIDEGAIGGVVGVTAGYTFSWVDNVTNTTVANAIGGLRGNQSYTIAVVRDATQCQSTQAVFLNENLVTPSVTVTPVDATTCAPANGALIATDLADHTYYWYNDNDAADENYVVANYDDNLSGRNYQNLMPGSYTLVVVNNTTSCKSHPVIGLVGDATPDIYPVIVNGVIPTDCNTAAGELTGGVHLTLTPNAFTANAATDQLITTSPLALPVNSAVVITRSGGTSLPLPLIANKIYYVQAIGGNAVSLSETPGGPRIDITSNGDGSIGDIVEAGYTFEWYAGIPSPSDAGLGSINYFNNPPVYSGATLTNTPTLTGVTSGLYTVQVTHTASGCQAYLPHTLPYLDSHAVLRINKTNSTICPYDVGNGSIEIQIEDPPIAPPAINQTNYEVTLFRDLTPIVSTFTPGEPVNPFMISSSLAPGSYTVHVRETYSGNVPGCVISQDVIIDADAQSPILSLTGPIIPNTACDLNQADGQIDFTISKDPDDQTGAGVTYEVTMMPDPNSVFPMPGLTLGSYSASDLGPDVYSFTVTASTGCETTRNFTVLNKPTMPQLTAGSFTITDAEYCDPLLEQSAGVLINQLSVVGGGPEDLSDYRFDWFTDAALSVNIYSEVGDPGATKGGEELSNTGAPLPSTPIIDGAYWVVATKVSDVSASGGMGCRSTAYNISIGASKVVPQISLTPFGDSACDPTVFEGSLQVDVTTNSGPGVAGTYAYTWAPAGAAGQPANSVGNSGVANLFGSINEGSYQLTAINEATGCFSALSTTVLRIAPPVFTLDAIASELTNCATFDGQIDNLQVFIDGAGGTVADFDYVWFKTDLLPASIVIDGRNGAIPVDTELSLATYPAIALDKYYVKAVRKAGGIGIGCESTPLRRDITDGRIYPQLSFSTISSTACDLNFDGQISVTASTASGPGFGANYNFVWTHVPSDASASNSLTANTPSPFVTPNTDLIGEGAYGIRVTNSVTQCFTDSDVSVTGQTIPMEIVSVTPTHVDVCAPLAVNGTGTVTAMTVNNAPGNTGDFLYTWANNAVMNAPFVADHASLVQNGLDVGTYYVTAKRNAVIAPATPGVTGSGCVTSPVPFTILDRRVTPTISFATISSTACDVNFDGQITVTASTASGPGSGANYNFVWTNDPDGLGNTDFIVSNSPNDNTPSPFATLATDRVGQGSYSIRVTNYATQCFTDGSVGVQHHSVPVEILAASATPQQVCYLPADGSVSVDLGDVRVGGAPVPGDISFAWSDTDGNSIGAGASVPNLAIGSYFVQATRSAGAAPASGCVSAPFKVVVGDAREYPVVSLVSTPNTSCNDTYDASITLSATTAGIGSASNYDIAWTSHPGGFVTIADAVDVSSPYTTTAFDNVGMGEYLATVTNRLTQCPSNGSVTVRQNTIPVQILNVAKIDQSDCAPFNGSIEIDTSNPAHVNLPGTYAFAWTKGALALAPVPDNMLTGADAGTYTVTGTKAGGVSSGCETAPFSVTLLDLTTRPVVELSSIANFACDLTHANGQLAAIIFDGTMPASSANYDLEWFAGKNVTSGVPIGTTDILANQPQGDYTLVAVDNTSPNRGCSNHATLAVGFTPTSFNLLVDATDQTLCFPAQNGSASVTGIAETRNGVSTPAADLALYDYLWSDESGMLHPSTPSFTAGVTGINNLVAGDYTVRVRNALGCVSTETAGIVFDRTALPIITLEEFTNPVVCVLPETGGYLRVSADNDPLNSGNYIFDWFEGTDDTGTSVGTGTPELSGVFFNDPLQYTVRVTNPATSCVNTETYLFGVETVRIQVLASAVGRTNCVTDDGTLFATTLNGNGGLYNYEWYTGPVATGVPTYTTKEITGVPMGQYTVIAVHPTHAFCESTSYTTRVTDERVMPAVQVVQRNPLTYCDPANPNGVAYASVGGQVIGYVFDWFPGTVSGAPIYTGPEVTGLTAATYVVRATDVMTQCENMASILIDNQPVNVPQPTVTVLSHLTNCVDPNGALQATVNGTTFGYLLQWYDGNTIRTISDEVGEFYRELDKGLYTTTATNLESGCISAPVVTEVLPFQELPDFDIVTVPTNCEEDIGSAELVLKNDIELYEIEWYIGSDVRWGARLSNLPKGEFSVIATTYQQCSLEKTFTIMPDILVFNGISRNNDNMNDYFEIACIDDFPGNNVKIFNRAGTLVYEANGYDNQDVLFDGLSNRGINLLGNELPDGTYFYIIDKRDGSEPRTGYLELLR